MAKLIFSVAYLVDGKKNRIWLGLKKARPLKRWREQLGVGLYNGFGGLQKTGEPIEVTARRETEEECGVEVLSMEKCGVALIRHDYDDKTVELHFFLVTNYRGKPKETDEMIPVAFSRNKIPLKRMWPNDLFTLPLFLFGRKCLAIFTLNRERQLTGLPRVKVVEVLPDTIEWEDYLL